MTIIHVPVTGYNNTLNVQKHGTIRVAAPPAGDWLGSNYEIDDYVDASPATTGAIQAQYGNHGTGIRYYTGDTDA